MRNSHVIRSSFWTFFAASVLSTVIANLNSVFSGMVVGVTFGFFPARRAARLSPMECLRYE